MKLEGKALKVSAVLQGTLDGDTIREAGIVAQPKTPKPAVAA
jgi:hypothetical protein